MAATGMVASRWRRGRPSHECGCRCLYLTPTPASTRPRYFLRGISLLRTADSCRGICPEKSCARDYRHCPSSLPTQGSAQAIDFKRWGRRKGTCSRRYAYKICWFQPRRSKESYEYHDWWVDQRFQGVQEGHMGNLSSKSAWKPSN